MAKSTYYVVQRFRVGKRGMFERADPIEARSAEQAISIAMRLPLGVVGAVAFSRTGEPDMGDWGDPVILCEVGTLPDLTQEAA